jgi:tripartite ATP-independent transporter DctM subunit
MFSGYIMVWATRNRRRMPPQTIRMGFVERVKATANLIPVLLLIVAVFLTMLTGLATANEASAFGVLGALVVAAVGGNLSWRTVRESLGGALRTSAMIMFILGAASFLTVAMGFTGIPRALAEWVVSLHLSPHVLIAALTVVYLLLGMALDGVSMIVLTSAVVIPMVQAAGFDLIWFGIYTVIMIELAQVTPPVGFNLFVLQSMSGQSLVRIALASVPFFLLMCAATVLLTAFPAIATWLPAFAMGK